MYILRMSKTYTKEPLSMENRSLISWHNGQIPKNFCYSLSSHLLPFIKILQDVNKSVSKHSIYRYKQGAFPMNHHSKCHGLGAWDRMKNTGRYGGEWVLPVKSTENL